MDILKLLFLDKSESFEQVMSRIEGIFKNVNLFALINKQVAEMQTFMPGFLTKDIDIKNAYVKTCCNLIRKGICKARGENQIVDKRELSDISKYLSFESVAIADERLLTSFYLENNFVLSLLTLSFYALIYIDKELCKRFELAYSLWRNSIAFSTSGYVPELKRFFPYYVTCYKGGAFLVNPVSGKVFKFIKKRALRNTRIVELIDDGINGEGVIYALTTQGERVPLIKYSAFSYEEIYETRYASVNVRQSEQMKNNTLGLAPAYMTTVLGEYPDENGICTNYTLREHLFVALMVHGIHSMKFAILSGFSPMTVDHINDLHSCNSIENLALLTRYQNIQKEYKNGDYYFNFFEFFSNQLENARIMQNNYNFRKNAK